ncbi:hypothetical protein [Natranaerofaba carboxydovora]|uniref:hypothetical protein n=1 Tax=Natranaerofaba carboxydovora TaxID=2742683 RepID=UPI001F139060|nr:hypothetical protein [Natranaerofaba carboxydovora]UMZ73927.1 hypothetical protein ACONDI_01497 [Natranaerofaba carboxydovora]
MKFIFFGDYLKGLYRFIVLLIILTLVVSKIFFLGLELLDNERYMNNIYEVTVEDSEDEDFFNKLWLELKESYWYGF